MIKIEKKEKEGLKGNQTGISSYQVNHYLIEEKDIGLNLDHYKKYNNPPWKIRKEDVGREIMIESDFVWKQWSFTTPEKTMQDTASQETALENQQKQYNRQKRAYPILDGVKYD